MRTKETKEAVKEAAKQAKKGARHTKKHTKKEAKLTKKETKKISKISLNHISKIEGHANLNISIKNGKLKDVELSIYEGARYFEGILKGKKFTDIPDIVSRICGVCSVVHCIASIKAIENAFGVTPSRQTVLIRNLLNIGGIIQSHVLHLYMMSLPDYLGFGSAIEMAGSSHKDKIEMALRLKRAGNLIVRTLGGRDIHPIAAMPGGFSFVADKKQVEALVLELKKVLPDSIKTIEIFSSLCYPEFTKKTQHFALHGDSYFNFAGQECNKVVCKGNICIPVKSYEQHFREYFKKGSTAEFAKADGMNYMVGASARIINNFEQLSDEAKKYTRKVVENPDSPFANLVAQAIEVYEGIRTCISAFESTELESTELNPTKLKSIELKELKLEDPIRVIPKAGEGLGAVEAPRGTLFHKYVFDKDGYCISANITTPTTQNLPEMEDAVRQYVQLALSKNKEKTSKKKTNKKGISNKETSKERIINEETSKKRISRNEISKEEIIIRVEELLRAYDPCISCATHFLEVEWG